jgi:hypothetical protein
MGMDIYFQAFDANDSKTGERQELRCRDIYHVMNRWCESKGRATPESGEHVSFDAKQWAEVAPLVCTAIAQSELDLAGGPEERARALGEQWLVNIWPATAHRVEYWFTV